MGNSSDLPAKNTLVDLVLCAIKRGLIRINRENEPARRRKQQRERKQRQRAKLNASGLTVDGKPRKRKPLFPESPLLNKMDHAAYMRKWRQLKIAENRKS